jgi:tight adherence protein C
MVEQEAQAILIPALAFVSAVALGGAFVAARAAASHSLRRRLDGLKDDGFNEPQPERPTSGLVRMLERVGAKVSGSGPSPALRQELARAGYPVNRAARMYLGAKMLLLFGGSAGLTVFLLPLDTPLPVKACLILAGGALLSFVPNLVVRIRREKRRREVRNFLPDSLDLLEVSVSAGMGLDMAWNSVADEIQTLSPVLASEMALTNLELHLGAPRATAMRHMAERTGAEEISSLVGMLIQSERFGTSVADALRTFAASMREMRSTLAEMAAEKMAVKLLFPMILFIFPAILIVTVGPAAVTIIELFGTS